MNYFNTHTPLQHIRKPIVQVGGLCWIVFAKIEDVELWPQVDPLSGICSTPIKLKEGKTWYELQVTDKNRVFSEVMKVGNAGPYWEMQVSGYVGGNNANLTLAAAVMQFHQYVVLFKDRDELIRFIGDQDTGADVEIQYNSGDKDASRKRTYNFTWDHHLPAPIYTGKLDDIADDIIKPPFQTVGDFNDDFNDDFN